ncbi:MAG: uracil-DNA glycosylase [Streptosporangiales bacterium]|nr:uracil-DNA glycosylase [Streptosporangiales bacterium]
MCRGREPYENATQAVLGEGASDTAILLLGEQPGDREDEQGKPFVGPAGGLLEKALGEAGIEPARTYRTNVVKHFKYGEVRGKRRIHETPNRTEIRECRPWLLAEMALLRPTVLVCLGATAAKAIFGPSFRVTKDVASRWTARNWRTTTTGPSAGWRRLTSSSGR